MLHVWVDEKLAGTLDRLPYGGSTFAYHPEATDDLEVSLSMPRRVQSYDQRRGLTPIFEMNLPEGSLREQLRLRFAKAVGSFDDFDLLTIVGRSQVGRIRYSADGEGLNSEVPFQSVDEILQARRGGELLHYLLDKFATFSGISGVQPKVMINANDQRTVRSATHIVKFADPDKAQLPANEFFCLETARRLGLEVPDTRLSDLGDSLVVTRFDIGADNKPLGFEDFCVLNGRGTADKYRGGYETAIFRRLAEFTTPAERYDSLRRAFTLFVLNAAVRNGDAHLKNWGVIYKDTRSPVKLAPVYDIVTTGVYLPGDQMALTLGGRPAFPGAKELELLGKQRANLNGPEIKQIFEATADALSSVAPELQSYFRQSSSPEIGESILGLWEEGIRNSLGQTKEFVAGHSLANAP